MVDESGEVRIRIGGVLKRLAPYTVALDVRSKRMTPAQLESLDSTQGVYVLSPQTNMSMVDVYSRQYEKVGEITLEEMKLLWAKCFVFKYQPRYFGEQDAFWVFDQNSSEADEIRRRRAEEAVTEGGEINAPS